MPDPQQKERTAHLADGRTLHFPANTSDEVITATVRKVLGNSGAPKPPTPGIGGGFAESFLGSEPTMAAQVANTKNFYQSLLKHPSGTIRDTAKQALGTLEDMALDVTPVIGQYRGEKRAFDAMTQYPGQPVRQALAGAGASIPLGYGKPLESTAEGQYGRAFGNLLGQALQLATVTPEVGEPMKIAGREFPEMPGQTRAESSGLTQTAGTVMGSFAGSRLREIPVKQQIFARKLFSDIASEIGGITTNPEEMVGTWRNSAETMRKAAGNEYDAIGNALSKGEVARPSIGLQEETAPSVDVAQSNARKANEAAKKSFEKPYMFLSMDEKQSILDLLNIKESDMYGPHQTAASIKGGPTTNAARGDMFRALVRERSDLGEKMFKLRRAGHFKEAYDLQPMFDGTQERLDRLILESGEPNLMRRYGEAKTSYARSYAIKDVAYTLDDVTKGLTKAEQEGAGFKPAPQMVEGRRLVEGLKELSDRGTLEHAVGPKHAASMLQTAEMLRRSQEWYKTGGFGHWMTTLGPLASSVAAIWHGSPEMAGEALAGWYGGLKLMDIALSTRSGRIALMNFLKSAPQSAERAMWKNRVLMVSSLAARGAREQDEQTSPQK